MSGGQRFDAEIPLVDVSGRNKQAESTDPYIATAVAMPTPGYDGLAAMGRAFVEEFALMGWSRDRIARMFEVPRFAAAHAVLQARGAEFVEQLISEVMGPPTDAASREES
jgi:hypothetical protein